jgi:hypothetical protein
MSKIPKIPVQIDRRLEYWKNQTAGQQTIFVMKFKEGKIDVAVNSPGFDISPLY